MEATESLLARKKELNKEMERLSVIATTETKKELDEIELEINKLSLSDQKEHEEAFKEIKRAFNHKIGDLKDEVMELKAENEGLRNLCIDFLDHYDNRKITNGFHDLLAIKVRNKIKGKKL